MKFVRFKTSSFEVHNGILKDEKIQKINGDFLGGWDYDEKSFSLSEVQLLAPLEPNSIIGIGANYVTDESELPDELPEIPVFFFKPNSSVIGPDEEIVIPEGTEQVKFESELAVVIGKEARNVSESEILDYVFGYTVGNDVTAPDFFHQDGHWTIGKSFDTFTPLGPVIETELDPFAVKVEARLNDTEKQNSPTSLMIVPIREMLSYLTKVMTLKPGDVILTGSPAGAELVGSGDVIACTIKEIGTLENTFTSARQKAQIR
ncbi:fumarylacetoacetate hydrolase family protein [Jeotgalibacillus proteolyticus]|uniref:Ureidoglycolate lyase n=1 Tax=Jeotgalibacillus proteolyticus TaxID=2082395 RepID=A0A2S5GBM9_9BACL|nr:fumarylacetoacetate hydrolase family protein [Jeotgalibacillus proteolyticus]PPA70321.1 ureidoglycolate lyase [Jeotgalibacillus proteolyticus]